MSTDNDNKYAETIDDVKGIIYMITNKQDKTKKYVGQTRSHRMNHGKFRPHGAQRRWVQHVGCAEKRGPNPCGKPCFYEDIRTLGADAFAVTVLEECPLAMAPQREQWHIRNEKAIDGYNVADNPSSIERKSSKGFVSQAKEAVRKETYAEVKITKAILMVIEGCAPKVSVFFETDDAKTNRKMKRTTFSAAASMEDAKARAEEFAKQHTPNIEYCTGRTKKDKTLENWKVMHAETPIVCLHIRGPNSRAKDGSSQFIQVLAQTEKAKTTRAMKKCEFFITSTVEEAKARAIEFAQKFQVTIADGVGQEKSTRALVPRAKKPTVPQTAKKRKHSEIETQK